MTRERTVEEKVDDLEKRSFTKAERDRILRAADLVLAAQADIAWLKAERAKAK